MTIYYQDELVTLYHGDCLEQTAWLDADVLVTDPPYGYRHRSNGGPRGGAAWRDSEIANDHDTTARDNVLEAWGTKPALVFGSWKRPSPDATRAVIIWDKGGHAGGLGDLSLPWKQNHEEVYVLGRGFVGKRGSGIMSGFHAPASEAAGRTHPHEKPASLMERLVGHCPPGVIADPFAGSGSTLVAAVNQGRKAIGVEYEERYCELIAKRLSSQTMTLDLGTAA